jgi:hypothetical protein
MQFFDLVVEDEEETFTFTDDGGSPTAGTSALGTSGGTTVTRIVEKDAGRVGFFPTIFSVNLFDLYKDKPDKLPVGASQYRATHDFHAFSINTNVQSREGVRGAKSLNVVAQIFGENDVRPDGLQMESVGPETEWKDKAVNGEIKLGVDTDIATALLKLIPVVGETLGSLPLPKIDASFNYKWNPKVGAVVSGCEGDEASWKLRRTEGKFLDGDHELMVILRRPRSVKGPLNLRIHEVSASFDVPWKYKDAKIRHGFIPIRLEITESSPNP